MVLKKDSLQFFYNTGAVGPTLLSIIHLSISLKFGHKGYFFIYIEVVIYENVLPRSFSKGLSMAPSKISWKEFAEKCE